jgi:hypothetical protein
VGTLRKITSFFRLMGMALSLPFYYMRYSFARRRAISAFKRELIASGVPPMEANELASLYPFKFSDLMGIARDFRAS